MGRRVLVAWGGRTWPKLRIVTEQHPPPPENTWQFSPADGLPQLKMALVFHPARQSVSNLMSGGTRVRRAGYRMECHIDFGHPANRDLVDFLRRAAQAQWLVVHPHPDELYTHDWSRDYFWVTMQDKWDPRYFMDRWVGHRWRIVLKPAELLPRLPVSGAGMGYTEVDYTKVAGVTMPDAATTGHSRWTERYWWKSTDPGAPDWEDMLDEYDQGGYWEQDS